MTFVLTRVSGQHVLEIETGKTLENPSQLSEKTGKNNNQKYKEWWFVVTNTGDKKEYEKHHQTMTRIEIKEFLKKY